MIVEKKETIYLPLIVCSLAAHPPLWEPILNSCTKQRVRLAGYEESARVALQPSYGEFWHQLFPTL